LIWREDGSVEDIEADQSYFLVEVNNITRKTFEKSLEKIAPCSFAEDGDDDQIGKSFIRLDPTHGFMLEKKVLNTEILMKDLFPLSWRNGPNDNHV